MYIKLKTIHKFLVDGRHVLLADPWSVWLRRVKLDTDLPDKFDIFHAYQMSNVESDKKIQSV